MGRSHLTLAYGYHVPLPSPAVPKERLEKDLNFNIFLTEQSLPWSQDRGALEGGEESYPGFLLSYPFLGCMCL